MEAEEKKSSTLAPSRTITSGRPKASRSFLRFRGSTTLMLSGLRPQQMVLGAIAVALPIACVAYLGESWIERGIRASFEKAIGATLRSARAGVELTLETSLDAARTIAKDPGIEELAAAHARDCVPLKHCAGSGLSARVHLLRHPLGTRHFLVHRQGTVWPLFDRDLERREAEFLARTLLERPVEDFRYFPPFAEGEDGARSGYFVPLGTGDYRLFLEVPLEQLSRPLLAARAGESGETYAVDRRGRMVSESRFLPELRLVGLLRPIDETSILRVEIRDPGVNLAEGERSGVARSGFPLTEAARRLVDGGSGILMQGYRDYRGVTVVGGFAYLPRYEFGIVTELDEREALESLGGVRRLFFSLVVVLAVVLFGFVVAGVLAAIGRARAKRALKKIESLGQYHLERKLGEGGMGTVYLARHALLRRPTAVKVMRQGRENEEAFARFEREVRATSELVSPHTVAIYDYGRSEDGTFFYAMEYLEGLDLEQLVRRYGPLPDSRVVHILSQVCLSLAEAHDKSLVHRDIKPSNVLLCRAKGLVDCAKVLDFGIVKADAPHSEHITRSSSIIGTPEFMAPEMFGRDALVTSSADLYSLGAVGYFLVTGRPVFDAQSLAELCAAHLSEEPVSPTLRSGRPIHPELEQILLACLAKEPESRPRSAIHLRKLLLEIELPKWTEEDAEAAWARIAKAQAKGTEKDTGSR